jgi:hypothetical protein
MVKSSFAHAAAKFRRINDTAPERATGAHRFTDKSAYLRQCIAGYDLKIQVDRF